MKSKRQTMSKMARERDVKARRARKLEKKYAAAAERKAKAEGTTSLTGEAPPNLSLPVTSVAVDVYRQAVV